ncbi:MAG: enoyl-CoA hydratase/isomerase family protein [Solirubrobacterales bacterium]|nr:enoyl-CoA hydratase/isomerase family protein [Solirubrobacterales bacterium]
MSYETLLYEVAGGVATISLNQPDTRNALSAELLAELESALLAAQSSDEVRTVVLATTHERVFSSGANLGAFGADASTIDKHQGTELLPRIFRLLGELGKPSLTAASGHVLAGALGLALSTDLIIASSDARFGLPEIGIGTFPFMVTALLQRNIGRRKANELLYLGEQISAEEAERIGLINKVVPSSEFSDAVNDWAGKLASRSPLIMGLGKDAVWRQQDMGLVDALDFMRSQLSLALSSEDIVEGVTAFFEKRDPVWKGR